MCLSVSVRVGSRKIERDKEGGRGSRFEIRWQGAIETGPPIIQCDLDGFLTEAGGVGIRKIIIRSANFQSNHSGDATFRCCLIQTPVILTMGQGTL